MTTSFWIPGPLPGQNEIVKAAKGARGTGRIYAAMKRQWTDSIALIVRAARVPRFQRASFAFCWIEKTKLRNPDNIAAGRKFVFDGLQVAGIIENDGWGQIAGWSDAFETGSKPGVRVTIEAA